MLLTTQFSLVTEQLWVGRIQPNIVKLLVKEAKGSFVKGPFFKRKVFIFAFTEKRKTIDWNDFLIFADDIITIGRGIIKTFCLECDYAEKIILCANLKEN